MTQSNDFNELAEGLNPQEQVDLVILFSIQGTDVKGNADLMAATYLGSVIDHVKTLKGNGELPSNSLFNQLLDNEISNINDAINSNCPRAQTRAYRDIVEFGSLTSADLGKRKAEIQDQQVPFNATAPE